MPNPPPPPPDTDDILGGRLPFVPSGTALFLALVALAIFAFAVMALVSSEGRKSRDLEAFRSRCIEFQTLNRCDELYRYKRQDLMEVRRH